MGQGDKYGHVGLEFKQEKRVPHGLNCGLFWHPEYNTSASNANLTMKREIHYADLLVLET